VYAKGTLGLYFGIKAPLLPRVSLFDKYLARDSKARDLPGDSKAR